MNPLWRQKSRSDNNSSSSSKEIDPFEKVSDEEDSNSEDEESEDEVEAYIFL